MCDAIKKKKNFPYLCCDRLVADETKRKKSEKEAQNQRVHNHVIVQTKADLKMCIREY